MLAQDGELIYHRQRYQSKYVVNALKPLNSKDANALARRCFGLPVGSALLLPQDHMCKVILRTITTHDTKQGRNKPDRFTSTKVNYFLKPA